MGLSVGHCAFCALLYDFGDILVKYKTTVNEPSWDTKEFWI